MDKIFDAANRADAQALIAHGRFLEAKFGHGAQSTMDVGESGTTQSPRPTNTSTNTLDL